MIICMNTKIKQNIIIIASTLYESGQNKHPRRINGCTCQNIIISAGMSWILKHINMALWCLVINVDYHLIDAFCLDVLSILHHALWPCQLGGDVFMHGYSKKGTPTFLCIIFNHYLSIIW